MNEKNLFLLIKNHITDFPANTFIKFFINVKVILIGNNYCTYLICISDKPLAKQLVKFT